MNKNNWWGVIAVAVILSVVVSLITIKIGGSSANTAQAQSVYDKVMKSGVITACYLEYPPALIKDPNTGKLSGIFYDALNKAAANMSLTVNWSVEVGWADLIPSISAGKCDIIGSPAWSNSVRGKSSEFSVPLYYSAINAYVRTSDNRFNGNPLIANNPQYTVIDEDGETSQVIVQRQFPNAKVVTIPQNNDVSEMLLDVTSNKADMAFVEASIANQFLKTHPGALKNVSGNTPVAVYGNVYLIKKGEFEFKTAIDNAMNELLGNGYITQLISQYGKDYPGGFYNVAPPYVVPNGG
jgi:polar amino acid transport system substrate-binding protein